MSDERIWVAEASWSAGPMVLYGEEHADERRRLGWSVTGPYEIVAEAQNTGRDGLDRLVVAGDVLEWIEPWVPAPARPLWRKAFEERFGG